MTWARTSGGSAAKRCGSSLTNSARGSSSIFGSYDFPIAGPRLRLNAYGGYSEFDINPDVAASTDGRTLRAQRTAQTAAEAVVITQLAMDASAHHLLTIDREPEVDEAEASRMTLEHAVERGGIVLLDLARDAAFAGILHQRDAYVLEWPLVGTPGAAQVGLERVRGLVFERLAHGLLGQGQQSGHRHEHDQGEGDQGFPAERQVEALRPPDDAKDVVSVAHLDQDPCIGSAATRAEIARRQKRRVKVILTAR